MKLSDWTGADCTLFRVPALDLGDLQKDLEKAMIDAWQNGYSAERAIGNILGNDAVISSLADQVQNNLTFQRDRALTEIEKKRDEKKATIEGEKQQHVQKIEQDLGTKTEQAHQQFRQQSQTVQQHHAEYTAAQADLSSLRGRIKKQLGDIGGEQGYEHLLTINQQLYPSKTEDTKSPTDTVKPTVVAQKPYDPSADLKLLRDQPKPLCVDDALTHVKEELEADQVIPPAPKKSFLAKTGDVIYKILTYELW